MIEARFLTFGIAGVLHPNTDWARNGSILPGRPRQPLCSLANELLKTFYIWLFAQLLFTWLALGQLRSGGQYSAAG